LSEAAGWYGQCHELAADNLLGLDKFRGVRGAETAWGDTAWEELEARADDRRIVAELLSVL